MLCVCSSCFAKPLAVRVRTQAATEGLAIGEAGGYTLAHADTDTERADEHRCDCCGTRLQFDRQRSTWYLS